MRGVGYMASRSITIRMDPDLKRQADRLFDDLGLNMTTALTMFVKAAVRQQRIPFEITADPFYSEANLARLSESINDADAKRWTVTKTMAELEAMEHE